MKVKMLVAVVCFGLAPSLAIAECFGGHDQVTMSCPEGQNFDIESKSCITPTG